MIECLANAWIATDALIRVQNEWTVRQASMAGSASRSVLQCSRFSPTRFVLLANDVGKPLFAVSSVSELPLLAVYLLIRRSTCTCTKAGAGAATSGSAASTWTALEAPYTCSTAVECTSTPSTPKRRPGRRRLSRPGAEAQGELMPLTALVRSPP